jgi:thiol-disulfide isomerase/thioredoxin
MVKRIKSIFILSAVGVVIIAGIFFLISTNSKPGKLDEFAQCLKDKGAVFYGAFWCPHCQNQKAMFGKSARFLPYIECSTPDGRGQLKICKDKNIEGYPTWEFADGSRESGEVSLSHLSEKTACQLPQ